MMIQVRVPKAPNEVAAALRGMRAVRGYTRVVLSAQTGIPAWKLADFEQGTKTPQPSEFARIWLALSTDPPPCTPSPEGGQP